MIVTKEFTVLMDDRPGALGKVCRALANCEVNILALQSFPIGGKIVTRFIVDNPTDGQDGAVQRKTDVRRGRNRPRQDYAPARRDRACSLPTGRRPYRYQLRILWLGARNECSSGLLRRHGRQQGAPNS